MLSLTYDAYNTEKYVSFCLPIQTHGTYSLALYVSSSWMKVSARGGCNPIEYDIGTTLSLHTSSPILCFF